jgi:hypothetical protein
LLGLLLQVKGVLSGRQRYAVLIAGFWLPFTIITSLLIAHGTAGIIISGMYSTIAWFGMGYMIWKSVAAQQRIVA